MARNLVHQTEALSAYRYLLRSLSIAFKGDNETLSAARKEARTQFQHWKAVDAEPNRYSEAIQEARAVGDFLRHNLIQGERKEDSDIYRKSPKAFVLICRTTDTR